MNTIYLSLSAQVAEGTILRKSPVPMLPASTKMENTYKVQGSGFNRSS